MVTTGVPVTVGGEQHDRLYLSEPVQDTVGSEVGRGRRESGAHRGGRQHHRVGLGHIGEPGGNPVSGFDASLTQAFLEALYEFVEIGPGQAEPQSRQRRVLAFEK